MARILGVNFTQDASIACVDSVRGTLTGLRKERLCGKKHAWGAVGDFSGAYAQVPELQGVDFDLAVGVFSSDPLRERAVELETDVRSALRLNGRFVELSHHLAHLYSMLPLMRGKTATALVIDCMGSYRGVADLAPVPPATLADKSQVEVATVYRLWRDGGHEVIGKQYWSGSWQKPLGLGAFYYYLTRCFFDKEGSEGKVMALASYGDPDALRLPDLLVQNGHDVQIPEEWLLAFQATKMIDLAGETHRDVFKFDPSTKAKLQPEHPEFRALANLAAAGQRAFERALSRLAHWAIQRTGDDQLLFGGGTALNCAANGVLAEAMPHVRITVPSWPDDGGTSIGAALWGATQLGLASKLPAIHLDYMGGLPGHADFQVDAGITALELAQAEDQLIEEVARLLAEGRVIGVCTGASEFGPRALGNRTLLADARAPQMRDFINAEIKGREWFRPVAPLVLDSHARDFFDVTSDCKCMQYAVRVKPDRARLIPSGVHVDGTARIQILAREDNPLVYGIIERFFARTGIPMLINTSLNPKDMPIVETRAQALAMLRDTAMHGLLVERTLYVKDSPQAARGA